jgi:hypothetical protein
MGFAVETLTIINLGLCLFLAVITQCLLFGSLPPQKPDFIGEIEA